MRKPTILPLLLLCCFAFQGLAQDTIFLNNPSFEDFPRHSRPPRGWKDCGFPGESAPDTQPSGDFAVTYPATDGETYLGMVVRDNETWESVSQRLSRPFQPGTCYEFSLQLARSPYYVSVSRRTERETNFNQPVKVRIYGGFDYCEKRGFLDETNLVKESYWMQYNFKFEPTQAYTYIVIEAFYETPTLFPYNGNVLVDNASPIRPIPCDEDIPAEPQDIPEVEQPSIANLNTPPPAAENLPAENNEPVKPAAPTPSKPDTQEQTPPPPAPKEEVTIAGVKRSEMKKGQTIRLDKLYFEADSARITKQSSTVLKEVADFMKQNTDVSIEIGGHTNNLPPDDYCLRLSTARAKAVAEYLKQYGIDAKRLQYKGYGKDRPVASNKTVYGRRQNQRVEIKILEIGSDG
ncbi:OmpA family protein [Phaeodactylibacter luteus]|uniref:OmpA family protein n=1 Tax=Phaeodactylibacter luteus TaxID=1564516 RepID=A0A5C6RTF9_9BACT|nr:OmpA family protein [Phaeodactylibacter luteus]TXB65543.1 OmpA family protein [Phaeodactylibacter luteus]